MSNNAMSNETDLDWLARNVHVWPKNTPQVIASGHDKFEFGATFCENHVCLYHREFADSKVIHKHQWLARRAELQNKPSWRAVPSRANWLAQDAVGSWLWHSSEPECRNGGWIGSTTRGYAAKGCVIGDWCDTLEKRPEDSKPFTSVEDNQDREGANQKLNELEMLGKVSHLISDKRHRITTSKYTKTIHGVPVDVYDVLQAWGVINPALQHLIKKALQCGQRGHKDNAQDLQDIIDSAIRAKELG